MSSSWARANWATPQACFRAARCWTSDAASPGASLIALCGQTSDLGGDAEYAGPNHLPFHGKPQAIRRAFQNLIDNAVKYGDCGRVSLTSTAGSLIVDVQDDGPGIAQSDVELAITPFRRLDRPNASDIQGAGLGLAIARDVLLAHGAGGIVPLHNNGAFRMPTTLPRAPAGA